MSDRFKFKPPGDLALDSLFIAISGFFAGKTPCAGIDERTGLQTFEPDAESVKFLRRSKELRRPNADERLCACELPRGIAFEPDSGGLGLATLHRTFLSWKEHEPKGDWF